MLQPYNYKTIQLIPQLDDGGGAGLSQTQSEGHFIREFSRMGTNF